MKTMHKIVFFLAFFFYVALVFCQQQESQTKSQEAQTTHITILHTNDHHGRVLPLDLPNQKQVGGMPARMSLVKEIRREMEGKNQDLLILDVGDAMTGEPLSDMFQGEPDILAMNKIGYHAMALGNHEFDVPLARMKEKQKLAQFPFLAANVLDRKTGKPLFETMAIWEMKGVKIAAFGITIPETPDLSTCGRSPEFLFVKPEEVIPGILENLRGKVDFIIALVHMDHRRTVALASQFPEIDLILGGHSHLSLSEPVQVGKTKIAEAGSNGITMGRWDIAFENGKVTSCQYRLLGINLTQPLEEGGKVVCQPCPKILAQDEDILKLLASYQSKAEEKLDVVIGEAKVDLLMGIPRCSFPRSSLLGNIVTDAMRESVGADIAMQNTGGIRTDILKGNITYRMVRRVLPFDNTIVTYSITGAQVMELLSLIAQREPREGGLFEFSGISFVIRKKKAMDVKVGGKPLEMEKTYKLATNSFIARGGDRYKIFNELSDKVDTYKMVHEALVDFIQRHSPLDARFEEIRMQWVED